MIFASPLSIRRARLQARCRTDLDLSLTTCPSAHRHPPHDYVHRAPTVMTLALSRIQSCKKFRPFKVKFFYCQHIDHGNGNIKTCFAHTYRKPRVRGSLGIPRTCPGGGSGVELSGAYAVGGASSESRWNQQLNARAQTSRIATALAYPLLPNGQRLHRREQRLHPREHPQSPLERPPTPP